MSNSTDDIQRTLGRLEAKLETLCAIKETQRQHGARIGSLERSRSWVIGAAAAVSAAVGFVTKWASGG